MLFAKLMPRDGNFFELFNQHGARIVEGARAFILLIENYNDPALREKYANDVGNAERHADRITADVNRLLVRSFVPIFAATGQVAAALAAVTTATTGAVAGGGAAVQGAAVRALPEDVASDVGVVGFGPVEIQTTRLISEPGSISLGILR